MKRSIIIGLLFILFANSVFAANLSAAAQATLIKAGVTHDQLNQIESSISKNRFVSQKQLKNALTKAGVTPAQMASINFIASTEASIATAGAKTTGGTGAVGTVAMSVGIGFLVAATAVGLKNALNGSKTKIHPVATTGSH